MAVFSDWSSKSRTELLLKGADLSDALDAAEARQKMRRRLGLGVLTFGVIALIFGVTLDTRLIIYAVSALQIPLFGVGLFLLAGQEVSRLRREVEVVETELGRLDAGDEGELRAGSGSGLIPGDQDTGRSTD